jgi:hypothetical protein
MSPSVLARVLFGDSTLPTTHLTIVPAVLHDYCRYKVAHADYPGIVPKPGTSVRGVYVSGLTSFDRRNLDIFEGAQYQRQKVNVKLVGKQEQKLHDERFGLQDQKSDLFEKAEGYVEGKDLLSAETYVFIEGEDKLEDSEWSFDEFVKEKLYRWADKSEEYAGMCTSNFTVIALAIMGAG